MSRRLPFLVPAVAILAAAAALAVSAWYGRAAGGPPAAFAVVRLPSSS
jgi:hypothetical protein